MDLSLFNNTANKVAPSDVSAPSSSRGDAQPSTQKDNEKFTSLLSTPGKTQTLPVQNAARSQIDAAAENLAQPAPAPQELQQAALDQTLFDVLGTNPQTESSGLMQTPTTSLGEALQAGLDPTLLQAQAVTSKQSVGVPVKIQAILDFILKSDGLAEKAPVLASLKAQARTPLLDLSSIVEESPFFKELELSANPEELLKKSMPVAQLLAQLQVSPKMLLALDAAGFDLRDKTSPEQVLKALGISPEKIGHALNQLQLGQAEVSQAPTMPTQNPHAQKKVASKEAPAETTAPHAPTTKPTEGSKLPQQQTQSTANAETPVVKSAATDPFEQMGTRMTKASTTKMSFQDDEITAPSSNDVRTETTQVITANDLTAQEKIPELRTDNEKIVTSEGLSTPTPKAPREETLEALLRRQFVSTDEPSRALSKKDETVEADTTSPIIISAEGKTVATPAKSSVNLTPDLMIAAQKMPISQNEGTWENKKDSFMGEGESLQPAEKEEELSNTEAKGPDFSLHEAIQHKTNRVEHKQEASAKDPVNESHFAERAKEIFDKAEMLVKDGGGSMKIDLSSHELGKLDLAVDVQADKVDLRIIASSENVKDILTQEIPKLRDALNGQNLHLKNVEISHQSMGGWNFNNQAQQQRTFDLQNPKSDSLGTRKVDSMRAFAPRPRSYANPISHSGQIQVLV